MQCCDCAILIYMTKAPDKAPCNSSRASDLAQRKMVEAAELEVLQRSTVVIPAKDWEAFQIWLRRPPEVIPALVELAIRAPSTGR